MDLIAFSNLGSTGSAKDATLLGGKGAFLCDMANKQLPIPCGVIIPTNYCIDYLGMKTWMPKHKLVSESAVEVVEVLTVLNSKVGVDTVLPLLSVRSGARVSMPGMMDTILNVGMTTQNLDKWVAILGERGAYDCYRRLIQMYGTVVKGMSKDGFEGILTIFKHKLGVTSDTEIPASELLLVIESFKNLYKEVASTEFPDSLQGQLTGAIEAVWKSWNSPRAVHYRNMYGYDHSWGTAVTVQTMVFGNMNDDSCSGVVFSRNPISGNTGMFGEYLVNAQGEDVVSGVRTPENIMNLKHWNLEVSEKLETILDTLETYYRDMQDVEFTVQDSELFILQTRRGKRSAEAAFKIAHSMYTEGMIGVGELANRVSVNDYLNVSRVRVSPDFIIPPLTVGIPAGGGVVSGVVALTSEKAVELAKKGPAILVRKETEPEDIAGIDAATGILTSTGGMTSHAAVVARGLNKSCVVGALSVVNHSNFVIINGIKCNEGEWLTIDGHTGNVWMGHVPTISETPQVALDVIDLLSNGDYDSVIFKGYGAKDIVGASNRLLIPFSWYGIGRLNVYLADVKAAVDSGLEVFVSASNVVPRYQNSDEQIAELFGITDESGINLPMVLDLGAKQFFSGEKATLQDLLDGAPVVLDEQDKIRICGTVSAYDSLVAMIQSVKGYVPMGNKVLTKMEVLTEVLKGGL